MNQNAPVPGWYPSDGQLRWWDGNQWTDQTQPLPQQGAPSAQAPALPPDTIWFALGKPLSGIGGGRYRLTAHYLFYEKGMLRTSAEQIPTGGIIDVDLRQSMAQKARGVGTLVVHFQTVGGTATTELEDIPNFREGIDAINRAAQARREQLETRANTQHFNHRSDAPAPQADPGPSRSATDEILAQLEKLGQLRDAGVLTVEEFDRKKAELLYRL